MTARNKPDLTHDGIDPAIDAAITRALGRKPMARAPQGFAATVAARAVAQPLPSRSPWLGWGPRLALGSAVLLTAGMFALAPHATPSLSNLAFDAEMLLFTELSGLLLFSHRLLGRD